MGLENWEQLANAISKKIAKPFAILNSEPVGGGCINTAYKVESDSDSYFVKLNSADKLSMFEAEYEGLLELIKANVIRVPMPTCTGIIDNQSYILMEYIALNGKADMQMLGHQLALLHKQESSNLEFGWKRNNTIGATIQKNNSAKNWHSFWNKQRLGYQLRLAKQNGASKNLLEKGERIQAKLNLFFNDYDPKPSLLHGDLWSGNIGFSDSGHPVIFDPAIYYGDRETDLAMTELFGGFSEDFYQSYEDVYPLDDGYNIRKKIYNLYHILNHYNLFGGSYEDQAERICNLLLRKL
ncbi:MAG: fructosamine kinase family protein [Gammaproteobacteria bacterium]|nr:fructosamine kinase family protein [Gammaproteobacteria bacterium]